MFSFLLSYFFGNKNSAQYKTISSYDDYFIYSKTNNNAVALETTNNIFLDLFTNIIRDYDYQELDNLLYKCMQKDPYKTIAIIFNSRDRIDGKKEKKISNDAYCWLKLNQYEKTYECNIKNYINKYGSWKDVLYFMSKIFKNRTYNDLFESKLFAEKLIEDKINFDNNESVSLCAKWCPSEKSKYQKKYNIYNKIMYNILDLTDEADIKNKNEYFRKKYLTPLRNKIDIVETKMCKTDWKNINYENVPSIASKKYKNAFMKNDEERYMHYLTNVSKGIQKINVTGILPHELVNYYLEDENKELDLTIENQWKTILDNMKKSELFNELIAVVDVSGSMFGASNGSIPAQVAIALGLLICNCCTGSFKNTVITFHSTPSFHKVTGTTLKEQVDSIRSAHWGYNTNFEKIADLIIDYGKNNKLENNEMPKKLVVLSDMQFDEAIREDYDSDKTELELLYNTFSNKFTKNNYDVPKMIYWNLNADNSKSFPVNAKVKNTAIISGFSEQLLKIFMTYDEFSPEIILDSILEKYIKEVYVHPDEI
tara:strand:+ start:8101 stop:9717 length:1617 start_codon:yes stop_codon:yes gene_type:complete